MILIVVMFSFVSITINQDSVKEETKTSKQRPCSLSVVQVQDL